MLIFLKINHTLTMLKVLEIYLTFQLFACPKSHGGAMCLSSAKLLGIYFPTSTVGIFQEIFISTAKVKKQ